MVGFRGCGPVRWDPEGLCIRLGNARVRCEIRGAEVRRLRFSGEVLGKLDF